MEVCEDAKACCDDHPHHEGGGCAGHEDGSCIIEDVPVLAHLNNELQYKVLQSSDCGQDIIPYYTVCFIVADLLNFDADPLLSPGYPDGRQGDYTSADVSAPQGLRAPPFGLV